MPVQFGSDRMRMTWPKLLNPNRVRPSTLESDHRAQFERDFDRAIFSTPVKRLQHKAQVFPLEPHDAVRTRLTHSLEVSAVARGLAIATGKWLFERKEISADDTRSIEAIAATCGLLHDLGNPPFGHSGESAIRSWFGESSRAKMLKERLGENQQWVSDFRKFEGNAQSLRLVAKLQILADYYGLNLTFGTLSALCKYTARSHEANKADDDCARRKPGYFASENDLVKEIRDRTGTEAHRNPVTYLVEAADDIVYSVADVEDAVKKGVFTWNELKALLLHEKPSSVDKALEIKKKILESDGTGDKLSDLADDVHASAFRTGAISVLVQSAIRAFKDCYGQIMEGDFKSDLVDVCDAAGFIRRLKNIGRDRVYCTPSTLKLELMGRRVIHDLMTVFWEGAEKLPVVGPPKASDFPGKSGALLSENYRRVFQRACQAEDKTLPEDYHRFQLLTDYVCGMTDTFAKRLHAELFNG